MWSFCVLGHGDASLFTKIDQAPVHNPQVVNIRQSSTYPIKIL